MKKSLATMIVYMCILSLIAGCSSFSAQVPTSPNTKDIGVASIRRVDVDTHIDSYLAWVPDKENTVAAIAGGSIDGGVVYGYDLSTGKSKKLLDLKDHSMYPTYTMNFFWSADGKHLVTGTGWAINLEQKSGYWIKLPEGVKNRDVEVLGLSPDGKNIFVDVFYEGWFFLNEATEQYSQFLVNPNVFPPHMKILAWSPDGNWLAARTYDPTAKTVAEEAPSPLYLLSVNGQEARLVTANATGRIGQVSFSSDGSKLIWCETHNDNNQSVFIANLDGSGVHEIFSNANLPPEYNITSNLLWSPDGSRIVYVGPPNKDYQYFFWVLTLGDSTSLTPTP